MKILIPGSSGFIGTNFKHYSVHRDFRDVDLLMKVSCGSKSTIYTVGENYVNTMSFLSRAIDLGIEQMKKNGDINE